MKMTVIGCGRWGSFIAWYLDRIGHTVTLCGRPESRQLHHWMAERKNEQLTLRDTVTICEGYQSAQDADAVMISVPSQNLQALMDDLKPLALQGKTFVLCMKGIEIATGRRLSQVAGDNLDASNAVAVWLGPGHVQEFCAGVPNCMVIDSANETAKKRLVEALSGDLIRFYYGQDLIGNEIGGAAKNVIGIAAGMLDGLNLSSLKGALMSRGTREVARLIGQMGGNELSAYGLCHLGDYEATVFSKHSHNRRFGEAFIKGESFTELAEGCFTVRAMLDLGRRHHVELPICKAVYETLYEERNAKSALDGLFARSLKNEF